MATNLEKLTKRRYLICLNTAILPKKIEITKDNFVISSRTGDLIVPNNNLERNHAVIRISGEYCYIHKINPDGITCVNEDTLVADERRALRSHDTICFGDVRYRYVEVGLS